MTRRGPIRLVRREGTHTELRSTPKPIERTHTHCILKLACTGVELEPLRMRAGGCAPCMRAKMAARPQTKPGETLTPDHHRRLFANPTVRKR